MKKKDVEYLPQPKRSFASNCDNSEMRPEPNASESYLLSFLLTIESTQVLLTGMVS